MNVRTIYDPKNDSLFVRLAEGDIVESEEMRPGVIFDYDADGRIVAFEVLNASTSIAENSDLRRLEVA